MVSIRHDDEVCPITSTVCPIDYRAINSPVILVVRTSVFFQGMLGENLTIDLTPMDAGTLTLALSSVY